MGSAAYQKPTIAISKNVGNVTDSFNARNKDEITARDEKRQILEWLSPLAPRERHRAVSESRLDGVGDWLLRTNEFERWHIGEDQAVHPVLFCHGDSGVGKTYLSSLVIDTLCDSIDGSNIAVAYVYCDFHAHKEQSAASVLAALLKQVVAGMEPISEEVKETLERAKREVNGRALRLAQIRSILVKSLSSLCRAFICIDALDEFPIKHRSELLDSLQHVVRECPNVRLFITGRLHMREEVKKYFPGYPDLAPVKPTKDDITGYIVMRLEKDAELGVMDKELEADILRIIPDRLSGAFLLVSLIMDAVLEGVTVRQRRQTLHKMTNGFGLDDAYSTTLGRIREQKGNRAKLGMGVLMWASHSQRPLKAEELCHALAVEVGTTDLNVHNVPSIRTLLNCTLGLVTIDEKESVVRLVHLTLQEYLATCPDLFITPHSMMAEICLTYLNFQSICELSITRDTIPSIPPFLHYASCYWGFHARKEMTEGVKHLASQHLQRDANHISAGILLRQPSVDFLSWLDRLTGSDPDLRGFTGLHCVSYMGITEIAIDMVNMKKWDLNARDSQGATPLIWAAKCGNYMLAKLLLEQEDVDPALSDGWGLAPVSHAARVGHEGLVKLLLERGCVNPESRDKDGRTPLLHAAESGHEGMVRILLERGDVNPDASNKYGQTSLSYAAGSGHEGVVKILLQREDVNPDSSDDSGRTPLSYAAGAGYGRVVRVLLERVGLNPDSSDNFKRTPLSYAAGSGHYEVVKMLLERVDLNPNSSGRFGGTPLSYAAESGHDEVVKMLLERADLDPNSSGRFSRTPLSYAAGSGHEGVVKMLLERGDVNPYSSDVHRRTPLSYAAGSGHGGVVKMLLERVDLNPNSSCIFGRTPLSYAAESGNGGVVRALLKREDVNPDPLDAYRRTPLSYAAESGHDGVVGVLLERLDLNPDMRDKSGRAPLSYAAESGSEGVVSLLLERGDVNSDSSDVYGRTPLSYAAGSGHVGTAKMLLERVDLNPDSSDNSDRTPLSYAAESGHGGVVKMLLEQVDLDPDSSDNSGRTPLSHATGSGHDGVVKMLLEQVDLNLNSLCRYGRTPLSYAAGSGHEGVVKILLERGDVKPDSQDGYRRTPLSYAAGFGHEDVVKTLLKRGDVKPDSQDRYMRTPLSYAAGSGHGRVVKMLVERGDVTPGSLDVYLRTPLVHAVRSGHEDVVGMLEKRRVIFRDPSDWYGGTSQSYTRVETKKSEKEIYKILRGMKWRMRRLGKKIWSQQTLESRIKS